MRMRIFIAVAALVISPSTFAAETVTYTYDAHGRLIRSEIAGGPANGVSTAYSLDPANNRTAVVVHGVGTASSPCTISIGNGGTFAGAMTNPYSSQVTRSGSCSGTITVSYQTRDSSAVTNTHYPPLSGTLTFTENGTQGIRTYAFPGSEEKDYYIDVTIQSGSATASPSSGTVYIDYA